MDVDQLRDVLWGGHVLVDDPGLYERWRFSQQSRQRISSHHHDIDRRNTRTSACAGRWCARSCTVGPRGYLGTVRKTPATIGSKKLPCPEDVAHLMDYIVYRVTRRNVGPRGLSHHTKRRPMYLNPDLTAQVSLSEPIARALAATLRRVDADERAAAVSDLAHRIPAPQRDDPVAARDHRRTRTRARVVRQLPGVGRRTPVTPAGRMLVEPSVPPGWSLPRSGQPGWARCAFAAVAPSRFASRVPGLPAEEARTP